MTTKTPEQVERAYEMLDHIERYPDSHNQNWWIMGVGNPPKGRDAAQVLNSCRSTACAAGWTVLLAGGVLRDSRATMPDGRKVTIPDEAASLLGLDDVEADDLFWQARDLAEVRKAVFDIFGPRP